MTWSDVRTAGHGKLKYRLSIDGWPDEWVTDADLEGTATDGRERRVGLMYDGLRIEEKLDLRDARIEVSGFTARIRSRHALAAFAQKPKVVAWLASEVSESATSWDVDNTAQSQVTVNDYYHAGSETVQVTAKQQGGGGDELTVVRTRWGTNSQKHFPDNAFNPSPVPIWDSPPSMHGRRATLYAYGDEESGASADGTQIWIGVVEGHPQLDASDQLTWSINIRPITDLLKQEVAPTSDEPLRVRGVYHSKESPFYWRVREFTSGTSIGFSDTGDGYTTGHFETDRDLREQLKTDVDAALAVTGTSQIDEIDFTRDSGGLLRCNFTMGGTARDVSISFYSPFEGAFEDLPVRDASTDAPVFKGGIVANGDYYVIMTGIYPRTPPPAVQIGPHDILPLHGWRSTAVALQDPSSSETHNRIYVDKASLSGVSTSDECVFTNAFIPTEFTRGHPPRKNVAAEISAVNTTDGHITVRNPYNTQVVLDGETEIVFKKDSTGNLYEFMDSLVTDSVNMNLGATPAITSSDINLSSGQDSWQTVVEDLASHWFFDERRWAFDKGQQIDKVIAQELQMLGGVPRITSDGKIGLAKAVPVADSQLSSLTLDASNIVTPGGGGSWPSFIANSEGIVNVVRMGFQLISSPTATFLSPALRNQMELTDYTVEFRNALSIAHHRNRGLGVQDIAPLSQPRDNLTILHMFDVPLKDIAERYFRLFSDTYYIVELDVLLSDGTTSVFQNALVGDVANVTCDFIPNIEDGTMGVTNKNALIIGRRWNLDPAEEGAPGRLTLMFRFSNFKGYAPSAKITGAANVSGNQWDLTVNSNDVAGNSMWPSGSSLSDHFAAGYVVTAWESDTTTINKEDGTIDSVTDPSTVRVTFDSTAPWGGSFSGTYYLRFKVAGSSADVAAGQAVYAYQADSNFEMYDTTLEPVTLL